MQLLPIVKSSRTSRCPAVAGESIHPYAGVHQVDFERGVVVIAVVLWLLHDFLLFHSYPVCTSGREG